MRTALYESHVKLKGRMVPFAGWEMPVQYAGILAEANAVRRKGGIFDVSHMGRIYVSGPQATDLMEWIQTGRIGNLRKGRARYSLICNEDGGIMDDTVSYRLEDNQYLLICNASNRPAVVDWLERWRSERFSQTTLEDVTVDTVMIAVQGPDAASIVDSMSPETPSGLRFFRSMEATVLGRSVFVGRTGYTGEDGFEIVSDARDGADLWEALRDGGMAPCGLGARDVLRLEAGLPLHGSDIDLDHHAVGGRVGPLRSPEQGVRGCGRPPPPEGAGRGEGLGGPLFRGPEHPPARLRHPGRGETGGPNYQRQLLPNS